MNVHHPAETPASHAAPVSATNRPYPGAVPVGDASSVWKERGKKAVQLAWKGVLLLLCAIAMLAGFGGKKGKRLRLLTRITSSVIRANASTDELEEGELKNLWGEDIVLLLVRHTNETDIADACASFWEETYKKKATFTATARL